jgi:hypothetical protein
MTDQTIESVKGLIPIALASGIVVKVTKETFKEEKKKKKSKKKLKKVT